MNKLGVVIAIVIIFLIHNKLSMDYIYMIYLELNNEQETVEKKYLCVALIFQTILGIIMFLADCAWIKVCMDRVQIEYPLFLRVMIIVLICFHLPQVLHHIFTRFAPLKYVHQHTGFFILVMILLTLSFLHKKIRPYKKPLRVLKIAIPCTISASVLQTALHWATHPLCDTYSGERDYKVWLRKINIIDEWYLISVKHEKLRERPILVDPLCKYPQKIDEKSVMMMLFPHKQPAYFSFIHMVGYIAVCDTHIEIILRGTQNINEWIGNMTGMTPMYSKTDDMMKHPEINSFVRSLLHQFVPIMKRFRRNTVVCAGHSRGSVMSFYICQQLIRYFPDKKYNVFLFAPPPLFDPRATRWIQKNPHVQIRTILTENDVMAYMYRLLPLGTLKLGKITIIPSPERRDIQMCFLRRTQNGVLKPFYKKSRLTWKAHRMDHYMYSAHGTHSPYSQQLKTLL